MDRKSLTRIASIVYAYYPADPRPRREAEALVDAGMSVDVICLRGKGEPRREGVNGVNVFRLRVKRSRRGKFRYLLEYGWFGLLVFLKLSVSHLIKPYDAIHVHNMPDALVFAALLLRLSGARIILDLHDPMPEVCMTKYSIGGLHPVIRLLCFLEKLSIHFSDLVLTPNKAFRDLFIFRGCPDRKIHIVMNSPSEKIFRREVGPMDQRIRKKADQFIIMYHGLIAERNGLDTVLEAVTELKKRIPGVVLHVFGGGDFLDEFLKQVKDLELNEIVTYHGVVTLETIARTIPLINVGIIPNKKNPFTDLNLPTRIFEYLSMGKPVIAPRTRGILDYFGEETLYLFDPGDPRNLMERILEVYENPSRCRKILSRGMKVCDAFRWELQREYFVKLVTELVGNRGEW